MKHFFCYSLSFFLLHKRNLNSDSDSWSTFGPVMWSVANGTDLTQIAYRILYLLIQAYFHICHCLQFSMHAVRESALAFYIYVDKY